MYLKLSRGTQGNTYLGNMILQLCSVNSVRSLLGSHIDPCLITSREAVLDKLKELNQIIQEGHMPLGKIKYIWEVGKEQVGKTFKKPFRLYLGEKEKVDKNEQIGKQALFCLKFIFRVKWYGQVL